MGKLIKSMGIYSICHFLVDFLSCVFILGVGKINCLNEVGDLNFEVYIAQTIIYNFFAFAFQVPMGFVMDRLKIYKYVGIIGFGLIGVCYAIRMGNPYIFAIIVGIGNGLFHLEGGVNAYDNSKGTAFLNGLFVAPGAMGIFLGSAFNDYVSTTYIPILLVVIAIMLLVFVQRDELSFLESEQKEIEKENKAFSIHQILSISMMIGISIIVRSIGGSAILYEWKTGFVIGLIYTICVVLGKMFGGLIGDKIGLKKTASVALLLSTISLILGFNIPFFGYIGIFLFNIPMSITLLILERCNLKNIATMVGLNTLFLFLGYLICMIEYTMNNFAVIIISIVLAIVSIWLAFKQYEKGEKESYGHNN